uniref:Uncharacterized protein n=1 Tax=Quercus lobata TaxID=97700 RepID=A0A7N2M3N7_QUELO
MKCNRTRESPSKQRKIVIPPPLVTAPPPSSSSSTLSSVSASLCSPTVFTLRLFPILYIRPLSKPSMSSLPWLSSSSSPIASLSSSPLPFLSSLNSKVVSQYSSLLAPLVVDSVLSVVNPAKPDIIDLRAIKIVKKLGDTVDDTDAFGDLSVLPDETVCAIFGFVFVTNPEFESKRYFMIRIVIENLSSRFLKCLDSSIVGTRQDNSVADALAKKARLCSFLTVWMESVLPDISTHVLIDKPFLD